MVRRRRHREPAAPEPEVYQLRERLVASDHSARQEARQVVHHRDGRRPLDERRARSAVVVEPALGDRLLLVEGIGRALTPDGPGPVVHHAFAVLSWDARRQAYRFDTYRAGENGVDAQASYEDGVFTWGFDTPNGKVRFRIRQTEAGDARRDHASRSQRGRTPAALRRSMCRMSAGS